MRLAIVGATGRMGQTLTRLSRAAEDISLVGAVCASSDPELGRDVGEIAGVGNVGVATTADVGSALLGADVVIDFSTAAAIRTLCVAAARQKVALVSGTTSLSAEDERALDETAKVVPVMWAPNMSLGVQVLAEVVRHALSRLGPGYDVEIVEVHHRRKLDAPSGTALRLSEAVKSVLPQAQEVYGRRGQVGARTETEVGVFGVRGGDVVGDHTVHVFGPGERLELTHRATNRDLFAYGALRAARFCLGKPAGRYTISDVLAC